MPFFEDLDGQQILERNSSRIEGMEMREATRLMKQFKRARDEIRTKLLITPSNTYTEAHLKNALVQIEDALRRLKMERRPFIQQAFDFFTEQGIEDGVREVNNFEKVYSGVRRPLPIDAIIESTEPENLLFNNFESSLDTYSANLRQKFQTSLTQALMQNKTWSQAVHDMDGLDDEWVLARLVRTELHGIYGMSKVNGFGTIRDQYIPDLKKTLYHPMDSRTGDDSKEAAREHLIVDIDQPFVYQWKGQTRMFMSPPDRPNDRSIVIPYRAAWSESE
jgi:hypothetical protein